MSFSIYGLSSEYAYYSIYLAAYQSIHHSTYIIYVFACYNISVIHPSQKMTRVLCR